jgi:hypothetical protein
MQISPRWTGVFRREGSDWRAMQIHASLGVSNEEAFGLSLSGGMDQRG